MVWNFCCKLYKDLTSNCEKLLMNIFTTCWVKSGVSPSRFCLFISLTRLPLRGKFSSSCAWTAHTHSESEVCSTKQRAIIDAARAMPVVIKPSSLSSGWISRLWSTQPSPPFFFFFYYYQWNESSRRGGAHANHKDVDDNKASVVHES